MNKPINAIPFNAVLARLSGYSGDNRAAVNFCNTPASLSRYLRDNQARPAWYRTKLTRQLSVTLATSYMLRIAAILALAATTFAVAAQSWATSPVLLHTFVVDEKIVGHLYGFREPNTMDAYARLEIRDKTSPTYTILYRVERTGVYLANGELDAEIFDDGSSGFFLLVQRPDYIEISCCRVGDFAMDNMTIVWNKEFKRFELFKI